MREVCFRWMSARALTSLLQDHLKKNLLKISIACAILIGVAVGGLVWNEARKEIFYLCGNFAPGTTEESVIRQLETGSFLRYTIEVSDTRRITVDSAYNVGVYTCVVELDQDSVVVNASFN